MLTITGRTEIFALEGAGFSTDGDSSVLGVPLSGDSTDGMLSAVFVG